MNNYQQLEAENKRLRQRLEALHQVSNQMVAAETVPDAAQILVHYIFQLGFERVFIALRRRHQDAVEIVAQAEQFSLSSLSTETLETDLPLFAEAQVTRYLWIDNVSTHPLMDDASKRHLTEQGVRSIFFMPIKTQEPDARLGNGRLG